MLDLRNIQFRFSTPFSANNHQELSARVGRGYSVMFSSREPQEALPFAKERLAREVWGDTYGELIPLAREIREVVRVLQFRSVNGYVDQEKAGRLLDELVDLLTPDFSVVRKAPVAPSKS